MRQQHGHIPARDAHEYEQQQQGDPRYDVRVDHGHIGDIQHRASGPPPEIIDPHRGQGADQRGRDRGKQRDGQRHPHRLPDHRIAEQPFIPVQGKPGPDRHVLGLVKGKNDKRSYGQVHEYQNDAEVDPGQPFFHSRPAPSPSLSLRLNSHMENAMIMRSTMESADP
ncbi:hypothetical protein SDC9_193477 [bioreactor metagenome]|uniref:Uncharacterized protein n=1 Tax=bioreactor metagenome TaxID=1076179 RepID=A0A645I3R6_9ZZZZ